MTCSNLSENAIKYSITIECLLFAEAYSGFFNGGGGGGGFKRDVKNLFVIYTLANK